MVDEKLEPEMWTYNLESQLYPGLHLKCDWKGKGGDALPLFCPCETPPEVLCPALGFSTWRRHGPVGPGFFENHEDLMFLHQISFQLLGF